MCEGVVMPQPSYPDWFAGHYTEYGDDIDNRPENGALFAGKAPAPVSPIPDPPPLLRDTSRLVARLRQRVAGRV